MCGYINENTLAYVFTYFCYHFKQNRLDGFFVQSGVYVLSHMILNGGNVALGSSEGQGS